VQKLINKKFLMRHLAMIFIFLLGVSRSNLNAQNDNCEQTLSLAAAEFEAGRFYGLPDMLKSCLKSGFSTEQKIRAYLLLTQAYLILDNPTEAEKSYLQLLKADPEYVANPVRDPIDVYYLSKKFTTTAIFTPYFRMGVNTSLPRTIYSLGTSSAVDSLSKNKTYKIGFQIGGGVDWNIDDHWSLALGLSYSKKNFKSSFFDNSAGYQGTFTEKQDWFDIPLYLKYSFRDSGKFRPFAYAGYAANLLIDAKLSPEGSDKDAPTLGATQVSQSPDLSLTGMGMRRIYNSSLVLGGGTKYKVGKNFFFVDLRYMIGLTNIAKNGEFNPLLVKFQYQSDFFRLDNLSISIGYIKPLYDPRKKKKAVAGMLEKLGIKKSKK
jgi:opacity protein-like surface antigen